MKRAVKQFNVYLPIDLVRELKLAAVEREESLSSLVEKAIRKHLLDLRRRSPEARRRR